MIYVDPGSASLVLQIVGAACIGLLFRARQIITRVKGAFRGKDSGAEKNGPASVDPES